MADIPTAGTFRPTGNFAVAKGEDISLNVTWDGTGNLGTNINNVQELTEAVDTLVTGGGGGGGGSNSFHQDRITINSDATQAENQYVVFKRGLGNTDAELIWNIVSRRFQVADGQGINTILTHGSAASEFPDELQNSNVNTFSGNYNDLSNRPSLFDGNYNNLSNKPTLFSGNYNDLSNRPTLFSGSWNDLTDKPSLFDGNYNNLTNKPSLFSGNYNNLTNKPDLSGIATNASNIAANTSNISANTTAITALQNDRHFQLSAALTEWDLNLGHTHTNSTSEDYASGYSRALQLNIPSRTSRAGTFEPGSDLDNNGDGTDDVTYNGTFGNINGLPDTQAELNNSVLIIEFDIPGLGGAPANTNFLEYERSDDSSGNHWIRLDGFSKLSLQKPGTGQSNAVGDVQKVVLSPLAGQSTPVDADPRTGDILALAIEYLPNNAIRFIPSYYTASTGSVNGGNDIDFTNSASEFGLNQLHIENFTLANQTQNVIKRLAWVQHSGYERHDLLRSLLEHGRGDPFFGAKTYNTTSTSTQNYEENFEFEKQLTVKGGFVGNGATYSGNVTFNGDVSGIRVVPDGGNTNQVLTKTSSGFAWRNPPSQGSTTTVTFDGNLTSNVLTLNSDNTGTTENASIVVKRGSGGTNNRTIRWNETADEFDLSKDGTNFYEIMTSNTVAAEAVSNNTRRWAKTKVPTALERMNDLEVSANNNHFIWINNGQFVVGGGYQTRHTNYDCTILDDFGKTTGFDSTTGVRSVRMPDITANTHIGWHTTITKDANDTNYVRVTMNGAGDIIGAADDPYVTASGSGDFIDLQHAGDSVYCELAGYNAGNGQTWWYVFHNLQRSKVPPRDSGNTTTKYLREDGDWVVPPDTQVDVSSFLNQTQVDARIATPARANDTSRWTAAKLPTDVVYDADITGFQTQSQVDARIAQPARANDTSRWDAAKLPTDVVYDADIAGIGRNSTAITNLTTTVSNLTTTVGTKANTSDVAILDSNLTGNGSKFVKVNPAGDGIEYADLGALPLSNFANLTNVLIPSQTIPGVTRSSPNGMTARGDNNSVIQDTGLDLTNAQRTETDPLTVSFNLNPNSAIDNNVTSGNITYAQIANLTAVQSTDTMASVLGDSSKYVQFTGEYAPASANFTGYIMRDASYNIYSYTNIQANGPWYLHISTRSHERSDVLKDLVDITGLSTTGGAGKALVRNAANNGWELGEATSGGTATPPVNITPSPAATTLTLTADQLNDYDELWFFSDGPSGGGDTIPIVLSTAAMKAMSFTGQDEIRYSGQMRAQWNHSTRTLTTGTNILYAELRKFSGGGGSAATTASDLLDLIDNSEGNVDAAASTDSSKIKLTAPSGGGRVTEGRNVALASNTSLTSDYLNKANFITNGGNTIRLTANNAEGVNGDKIIIFHAGPSSNSMVIDATSPINNTSTYSVSLQRGRSQTLQKFSGKWYAVGELD